MKVSLFIIFYHFNPTANPTFLFKHSTLGFADDLREYFSSYGNVVDHQIMLDRETGRSRGFGFVSFDNEDTVERVLSDGRMHELGGKQVSQTSLEIILLLQIK